MEETKVEEKKYIMYVNPLMAGRFPMPDKELYPEHQTIQGIKQNGYLEDNTTLIWVNYIQQQAFSYILFKIQKNFVLKQPKQSTVELVFDLRHVLDSLPDNSTFQYDTDWDIGIAVNQNFTLEDWNQTFNSSIVKLPDMFKREEIDKVDTHNFNLFTYSDVYLIVLIRIYNKSFTSIRALFLETVSITIKNPIRAILGENKIFAFILQNSNSINLPLNLPVMDGDGVYPKAIISYTSGNKSDSLIPFNITKNENAQNIFVNNDRFWGQMVQLTIPYIPYFSNCQDYGQYLYLHEIIEDPQLCTLYSREDTVPVEQIGFQQLPISDFCKNLEFECLMDDAFLTSSAFPKLYQQPKQTELFYITSDPIDISSVVDGYIFNPLELIPIISQNEVPTGYFPANINLKLSYFQVDKSVKKIIKADMTFNSLIDKSTLNETMNFNLTFSFYSMSHAELAIAFALDWPIYLLLSCIIGIFSIVMIIIYFLFYRISNFLTRRVIATQSKYFFVSYDGFKEMIHEIKYFLTLYLPVVQGIVIAILPNFVILFFASIIMLGGFWSVSFFGCEEQTDDGICEKSLLEIMFEEIVSQSIRRGRLGAAFLIIGVYTSFRMSVVFMPQSTEEKIKNAVDNYTHKNPEMKYNLLTTLQYLSDKSNLLLTEFYDGNIWREKIWERGLYIFMIFLVSIYNFFVIYLSFSVYYGENAWMFMFLLKLTQIVIEESLKLYVENEVLLGSLSQIMSMSNSVSGLGATDFFDFLFNYFVNLGISCLEKTSQVLVVEELSGYVFDGVASFFQWIDKQFSSSDGENDDDDEDEDEIEQIQGEGNEKEKENDNLYKLNLSNKDKGSRQGDERDNSEIVLTEYFQESFGTCEDISVNEKQAERRKTYHNINTKNNKGKTEVKQTLNDIESIDEYDEKQKTKILIEGDQFEKTFTNVFDKKFMKNFKKKEQKEENIIVDEADIMEFETNRQNKIYTDFCYNTFILLETPFQVISLWMFYDANQAFVKWGITKAGLVFYFLFNISNVPFQIFVDILLLKTVEQIHQICIKDYVKSVTVRYQNRKCNWKNDDDSDVLECLEDDLKFLDAWCFSSQYFFSVSIINAGISFNMINLKDILNYKKQNLKLILKIYIWNQLILINSSQLFLFIQNISILNNIKFNNRKECYIQILVLRDKEIILKEFKNVNVITFKCQTYFFKIGAICILQGVITIISNEYNLFGDQLIFLIIIIWVGICYCVEQGCYFLYERCSVWKVNKTPQKKKIVEQQPESKQDFIIVENRIGMDKFDVDYSPIAATNRDPLSPDELIGDSDYKQNKLQQMISNFTSQNNMVQNNLNNLYSSRDNLFGIKSDDHILGQLSLGQQQQYQQQQLNASRQSIFMSQLSKGKQQQKQQKLSLSNNRLSSASKLQSTLLECQIEELFFKEFMKETQALIKENRYIKMFLEQEIECVLDYDIRVHDFINQSLNPPQISNIPLLEKTDAVTKKMKTQTDLKIRIKSWESYKSEFEKAQKYKELKQKLMEKKLHFADIEYKDDKFLKKFLLVNKIWLRRNIKNMFEDLIKGGSTKELPFLRKQILEEFSKIYGELKLNSVIQQIQVQPVQRKHMTKQEAHMVVGTYIQGLVKYWKYRSQILQIAEKCIAGYLLKGIKQQCDYCKSCWGTQLQTKECIEDIFNLYYKYECSRLNAYFNVVTLYEQDYLIRDIKKYSKDKIKIDIENEILFKDIKIIEDDLYEQDNSYSEDSSKSSTMVHEGEGDDDDNYDDEDNIYLKRKISHDMSADIYQNSTLNRLKQTYTHNNLKKEKSSKILSKKKFIERWQEFFFLNANFITICFSCNHKAQDCFINNLQEERKRLAEQQSLQRSLVKQQIQQQQQIMNKQRQTLQTLQQLQEEDSESENQQSQEHINEDDIGEQRQQSLHYIYNSRKRKESIPDDIIQEENQEDDEEVLKQRLYDFDITKSQVINDIVKEEQEEEDEEEKDNLQISSVYGAASQQYTIGSPQFQINSPQQSVFFEKILLQKEEEIFSLNESSQNKKHEQLEQEKNNILDKIDESNKAESEYQISENKSKNKIQSLLKISQQNIQLFPGQNKSQAKILPTILKKSPSLKIQGFSIAQLKSPNQKSRVFKIPDEQRKSINPSSQSESNNSDDQSQTSEKSSSSSKQRKVSIQNNIDNQNNIQKESKNKKDHDKTNMSSSHNSSSSNSSSSLNQSNHIEKNENKEENNKIQPDKNKNSDNDDQQDEYNEQSIHSDEKSSNSSSSNSSDEDSDSDDESVNEKYTEKNLKSFKSFKSQESKTFPLKSENEIQQSSKMLKSKNKDSSIRKEIKFQNDKNHEEFNKQILFQQRQSDIRLIRRVSKKDRYSPKKKRNSESSKKLNSLENQFIFKSELTNNTQTEQDNLQTPRINEQEELATTNQNQITEEMHSNNYLKTQSSTSKWKLLFK